MQLALGAACPARQGAVPGARLGVRRTVTPSSRSLAAAPQAVILAFGACTERRETHENRTHHKVDHQHGHTTACLRCDLGERRGQGAARHPPTARQQGGMLSWFLKACLHDCCVLEQRHTVTLRSTLHSLIPHHCHPRCLTSEHARFDGFRSTEAVRSSNPNIRCSLHEQTREPTQLEKLGITWTASVMSLVPYPPGNRQQAPSPSSSLVETFPNSNFSAESCNPVTGQHWVPSEVSHDWILHASRAGL